MLIFDRPTVHNGEHIIQLLKNDFDNRYKFIQVGDPPKKAPFNTEKIIEDLIHTGISPFDTISILYKVRPKLRKGLHARKIAKLLNQAIREKGYNENYMIWAGIGNYVYLRFKNNKKQALTFRYLRKYVTEQLRGFSYTSGIFKTIVEGLNRLIRSLEIDEIGEETLYNLFLVSVKKTTGINPWETNRYQDDYSDLVSAWEHYNKNVISLTEKEKHNLITSFIVSAARILLLSYDFLPSLNNKSTISQLEKLIAMIATKQSDDITFKPFYDFGKLGEIVTRKTKDLQNEKKLNGRLLNVFNLIEDIVHKNSIRWIIVSSDDGTEFFSKFSKNFSSTSPTALYAPALTGIQLVIQELANGNLEQIQNEHGTIMVENAEKISVIALVQFPTHLLKQKLMVFVDRIHSEIGDKVSNFKGVIDDITNTVTAIYYELGFEKFME